ncbi:MAG: YciI family protein [Flavobacterium nitrogenifigens]|uniref:YciI family protein n=1 Tax=Flavobacterium nitrogenifigens TaxID=1617283 RepID=UPI002806AFF0|nr:YciI family protein [Flavobacterium nitrogenifigens]MDQ8013877.1 YciI family protein [Flavobacterium nitrogenifigens]
MKKPLLVFVFLVMSAIGFSQETEVKYDEALAKSLHADEYGMKKYVFCLLKSGSNTTASKEETKKLFAGHMENIGKLAKEGKLAVAGPFMKNDRNYRGIYIFNVETVEEAKALVATDPAIKANLLEAELTPWYCSAALQEIPKMHEKIAKTKM